MGCETDLWPQPANTAQHIKDQPFLVFDGNGARRQNWGFDGLQKLYCWCATWQSFYRIDSRLNISKQVKEFLLH
jgi:hypothetical protein